MFEAQIKRTLYDTDRNLHINKMTNKLPSINNLPLTECISLLSIVGIDTVMPFMSNRYSITQVKHPR